MVNKTVLLANPRGFCAGVDRAIEVVEQALKQFGAPVYVRHEIVHNRYVVERLRGMGAKFVDTLDQVPEGAVIIFSAHGVSRAVVAEGGEMGLQVIDATCPLVTKVHREMIRHVALDRQVILIGHSGHPEVEGVIGQVAAGRALLVESEADVATILVENPEQLAFVTQTTLSVDDTANIIAALQSRFPSIIAPKREDICYATSNRQQAVKKLAERCSVVLVIGSINSSNSNRLREVAESSGAQSYLIDDSNQINLVWLQGCDQVGVTAGASAPESLVEGVIVRLQALGFTTVKSIEAEEEKISFTLPPPIASN
ncbi:MAG: 4-hydroxy-3-methylbut-2-enyl diphosphate reductase [Mariprofundales bacterium]